MGRRKKVAYLNVKKRCARGVSVDKEKSDAVTGDKGADASDESLGIAVTMSSGL